MPNNVELKRQATAFAIDQNPTEILIHRIMRGENPNTGGKIEEESTVGPFTCRIIPPRPTANNRIITAVAGTEKVSAPWMLLAPYNADVIADDTTTDEFAAGGKYFRVTNVIKYVEDGQVTSIQAELEVI